MSKTNANVFEGARCIDRWNLFDSTSIFAHEKAAKECAACPALEACGRRRDEMMSVPNGYYAEGTWAGALLGSRAASDVA